jgi:hypothetical protein
LGVTGPKHSVNHSIVHQNWVFAVVIFGLYDPKTGSKLGLSGPKWCHKLGCNTPKPKPGSNLGYGSQNGVRNGLFTQKLDLWTAFGYTGFSVYGLFGSGAFGYTGFWVYGLFGSYPLRASHKIFLSLRVKFELRFSRLPFMYCSNLSFKFYPQTQKKACGILALRPL